jgi:hypothetical protein
MEDTPGARDYYAVLQVRPDAHPEVVRAAYRTLLKALGNHPDLGGDVERARTIIEAYKTLSNPDRRRAYDLWLKVHSRPAVPVAVPAAAGVVPTAGRVPPGAMRWIRRVLSEYHDAPAAPFAKSFDAVLERPGLLAARVYVKSYPRVRRTDWKTIFILCRAVGVARHGLLPSTDVVLLLAERVEDIDAFFAEAKKRSAEWAWNRCLIGVCTLWPVRVHTGSMTWVPPALRRLQDALGRGPDPLRGAADS